MSFEVPHELFYFLWWYHTNDKEMAGWRKVGNHGYFVPSTVQDNARVHLAALVNKDVQDERLFTFAYPCSRMDILAVFTKLYPERKFRDDIPALVAI
jgi:hypothetical protein